ncbi:uncharacterized protein LOC122029111 [Zingiber officinale]|uniref:uncharacterized protein LOC122029111 n=1 Tax=Zingiber officinale TaxID=94328 RepID=UPI001C4AE2FA|nr:uncharacterized protein LOC122029111 [Zingiber officinale]
MGSATVLASLCNGGAASASAASRSGTKDPPQNLASGGESRLGMSAASQIKSPPCTRLFIPSGNRSEVDPEKRSKSAGSENHNSRSVSSSPDKDDRCYTTRGSATLVCEGENADERASAASLPRFFVSLSNKEKEEDFMVMKGCKLPQRPKKRSKFVQKCILLMSPGAWLSDLSQERYVVREKKGSRKRRRGLKAMSMESDSE